MGGVWGLHEFKGLERITPEDYGLLWGGPMVGGGLGRLSAMELALPHTNPVVISQYTSDSNSKAPNPKEGMGPCSV